MNITAQHLLMVGQAHAWDALNDASLLQQAIPGCEALIPAGEQRYDVVVTASIGPVKARFKGKLILEDLQPPVGYTLRFEGQGGAAGHGKGSATVRLEAAGADQTALHYTAHANVGGKLAQIGSRIVDLAAQKMAGEFFDRLNAALAERHGAVHEPLPEAPRRGLLARFVAWLRGLRGTR